jgi:hypothetical protein
MKILTTISKSFLPVAELTHPFLPPDTIIRQLPETEQARVFGTPEFNLLGKEDGQDIAMEMEEMKEGELFFYIDSDVLLNAPVDWFVEQLGDNDMICQNDGGTACLGFYIAKVSPEMIRLFQAIKEGTNPKQNCQIIFNKIRSNYNLKIALFNTQDVWNYGVLNRGVWNGEPFDFPSNLKAFHANYTVGIENKVKLLNKARDLH